MCDNLSSEENVLVKKKTKVNCSEAEPVFETVKVGHFLITSLIYACLQASSVKLSIVPTAIAVLGERLQERMRG